MSAEAPCLVDKAIKAIGLLLLCHDTPTATSEHWAMAWRDAAEVMHAATGYEPPAERNGR